MWPWTVGCKSQHRPQGQQLILSGWRKPFAHHLGGHDNIHPLTGEERERELLRTARDIERVGECDRVREKDS